MSSALRAALGRYMDDHPSEDGFYRTPIEGLVLMRTTERVGPAHLVYKPLLCIVLQGAKQVMLGNDVFDYGAMQYLAVSVDLPVVGRVTQATAREPYLALTLDLDIDLLREVAGQFDDRPKSGGRPPAGAFVGELEPQIADCLLRLLNLAEAPKAIAIVYPAIARELYYWLIASPHGAAILDLALPNSPTQRIAETIHVIRSEFAKPLRMERLAAIAHMSLSSFHQHFKAVTSMTPLQFQKQLRLLEARRLMLANLANATHAAYEVGYESTSQFSREYARVFGAPPRRDVVDLRAATA